MSREGLEASLKLPSLPFAAPFLLGNVSTDCYVACEILRTSPHHLIQVDFKALTSILTPFLAVAPFSAQQQLHPLVHPQLRAAVKRLPDPLGERLAGFLLHIG